jgi:hypothetical protein
MQDVQGDTREHGVVSQTREVPLIGTFLSHQMIGQYYLVPGVHIEENVGDSVDDMDMDRGALAPALKAPRAP